MHPFAAPVLAGALLVGAVVLGVGSLTSTSPATPVGVTAPAVDGAPSARAPDASPYVWPTGTAVAVLRHFDPPAQPWASGHRGVDLELAEGAAVLAAGDGAVAFAGSVAGRGVVSIDHADGIRTTYEPVSAVVAAGDLVRAGQVIGYLAGDHCAPASCLHWGARRGPQTYVDPMLLLRAVVIRLFPEGSASA